MESPQRPLAVLFLVVVIDLLGWGLFLPMLPLWGARLASSGWVVGLLLASFSAMQFVFSPVWGAWSDRIGRRPVLLAGLLGSAAFYLVIAYGCHAASLPLLFLGRIGAGISGATLGTAQAYIADRTTPERRSSGMMLIGIAFGVGFSIGPALGAGAILSEDHFRGPDPQRLHLAPALGAAALSALAWLFAWRFLPESRPATGAAPRSARFDGVAWRLVRTTPGLATTIGALFLATLAFGQFETTLAPALEKVFHQEKSKIYWVFAYVGALLVIVQGSVRPLAKRWPELSMARIGAGAMVVGIGLALLGLQMASLTFLLATMPVLIFGFSLVTPALQALVSKRAAADRQGAVLGVSQSASALARILAQLVGVSLLEFSVAAPYVLSAGLLMAACALVWRRPAA